MIGLTKPAHVAPKMQHVAFCNSIVRFDWCVTKRIDTVCGVTWIPLCARDGSMIRWGRGEGETLSIHVVWTQCARGLILLAYSRVLTWLLEALLTTSVEGLEVLLASFTKRVLGQLLSNNNSVTYPIWIIS